MFSYSTKPIWIPYPLPQYSQFGDRDMEFSYLEELYPEKIKYYQKKVMEEVDRYDYQGSILYDEYPDRLTLYRMAVEITEKIKAARMQEDGDREYNDKNKDTFSWGNYSCELLELVQVLLYQEIYKRKQSRM